MPFLIASLAIVFVGCSVPLISSKPDMKEVEKKIDQDLTFRLIGSTMPSDPAGSPTVWVDCPDRVRLEKGSTFECDATIRTESDATGDPTNPTIINDEERKIDVEVLDDDGKFRWELEPRG